MRVIFCSSEVVPFAKTGGMADVCGALPLALKRCGVDVDIIMPFYRGVDDHATGIKRLNNDVATVTINDNIRVYFITNKAFFDRGGLYGDTEGDYKDNLERFQFFCQKSLEVIKILNVPYDIVHTHDWPTALIPVYLKSIYKKDKFFAKTKSVFTIHNLAYQGLFPAADFEKLGIDPKFLEPSGLGFSDKINLLKGGLLFSDWLTTVSPQYAREIQTEHLGRGLDNILRKRKSKITGILNGIDQDIWNPATDTLIAQTYDAKTPEGKAANKGNLQKTVGLKERGDVPLFGFVGRFSSQKGLDLLNDAMDTIVALDVQMVFLGVGEERYHRLIKKMAARHKTKIAAVLKFDEKLAHNIYAGSDLLLMPSKYEPCGLSQMIALRYGTIPLVFKTGGLADTVTAFDATTRKGNGFVFDKYEKDALCAAVQQAVEMFQRQDVFKGMIANAFTHDFSWDVSAKHYQDLYTRCLS